jgi:hypothetical protein
LSRSNQKADYQYNCSHNHMLHEHRGFVNA